MQSIITRIPIVMVSNGLMLPGLHSTLASFLDKNKEWSRQFEIHIFTANIAGCEKRELIKTAKRHLNGVELSFHETNISPYLGLKPLQGDYMTYMRLGLPRIFPEADRILYLDADLLIEGSLQELAMWPLGDAPFAASAVGRIDTALEQDFYQEVVGLQKDDRAFNAGVLLINAKKWRSANIESTCIQFGMQHRDYLWSADQTLLTALFSKEFISLPDEYNVAAFPQIDTPKDATILHFVGSPKPWDPLACLFHRSWSAWSRSISTTGFRSISYYIRHFPDIMGRMWNIRRSYMRSIGNRILR